MFLFNRKVTQKLAVDKKRDSISNELNKINTLAKPVQQQQPLNENDKQNNSSQSNNHTYAVNCEICNQKVNNNSLVNKLYKCE